MLAAALTGIAACGVKSRPAAPEGATYPRHYPAGLPPLAAPGQTEQRQAPVRDPDGFYQYPNVPPRQ